MKDRSAGVGNGADRTVLVVTVGRTASVLLLRLLLVMMLLLLPLLPFFPLLFLLLRTRRLSVGGSENGRAVTRATGGAASVGVVLAEDSVPAMALAEAGGPRGFLVGSVRGLERHEQPLGTDMSSTYRTSWAIRPSR